MSSRRLRELAGLPRVAICEKMSRAQMVDDKWTDGTYTEGDSITYRGLGWNLEWEEGKPLTDSGDWTEGAWYAVGDDGDEFEFKPGMEDRHDPQHKVSEAFPENRVNEATGEGIQQHMGKHMELVERLENTYKRGGFMEKSIKSIGGDPSGLHEVRKALEDLYRALEEADYYARVHLPQE